MKPTGNLSLRKFCLLLLMMVSYTDTYVLAAPRGGHVVSGTATFEQNGPLTVVTASNHSIINYGSFDIAAGETVRFVQPSANSSVLNRVVGSANPTEIFGSLQANGHVFIVNPYGIFFRNGSVINVGSLYAGAGNLSDADFTKGKVHFTDLAGDVRNDGLIIADNHLALIGVNVVNTGSLTAAHGLAMMVSGKDVYVGEKNGNIFVHANGGPGTVGMAASGSVVNRGTVAAPRVLLGGGDLYSTAISNSGLLQGSSVVVNAGHNGTATIGGRVDATSGANHTADGKGGSIQVLGGTVALKGAVLDASGANGGGSVRVGGDFHGGGTLAHAATTTVDAATTIKADATGASGDGGTVVVWSDQATVFNGQASARGGTTSGNGGSAEVSSANALGFNGGVDLRAPGGTIGSLLLDPHNITISDDAAATTIVGVPPTTTVAFTDTPAADLTISAASLGAALGTAAVTLQANTDITFNASVTAPAPTTGTGNLTLQAGRSILFTPTATNPAITLSLQGTLTATFNDGAIYQPTATVPVDTTANRDVGAATFTMGAGSKIVAPAGVTINGGTNTRYGDGTTTTVGTLNGNTGDITITDISTASATAGTASGNIDIEQNAGTTGKNITVSGALTSTPTAANTAGGNVTVISTGETSVAGIPAAGTGTGLGGTVSLQGVAANGVTAISLNGAITGNGLLDAGLTTISTGGTVTTASLQQYGGGLELDVPVTLTGGSVTADSLVGNDNDLTVNSSSNVSFGTITSGGNLSFNTAGGVGSNLTGPVAATSLTTTGGGFNLSGGSVTTSSLLKGQSYGGEVRLGADATLTDTAKGPISFALVNGLVNGPGTGFALKVDTGGMTTFNNTVGAVFPLGGLTVTGAANLAGGTVATNGTAGQNYQGAVTLSPTGGTTTLTAGTGPIEFDAAVSGNTPGSQALTLTTSGLQTLGGAVGTGADPVTKLVGTLASLTTGTGTVDLNGGAVNTTGAQTYNGPVVLGQTGGTTGIPVTTTLTAGAGGIDFTKTLDGLAAGTQALTLTTAGTQTFGGMVGTTVDATAKTADTLASLTTGTGPVTLDGGTVNTAGAQTYNGAVTLGANTVLLAGSLTLASTINGAATPTTGYDLTLTIGDAITLSGSTGGAGATGVLQNIGNFVSNGTATSSTTTFNGDFETYGTQSFTTPVFLTGNRTFRSDGTGTGANITFAKVDSSTTTPYSALTVNTSGATTFNGQVGSTNALGSVTTDAGGSTVFNVAGGGITVQTGNDGLITTGAQNYNDKVTVQHATTLQSSAVGLGTVGGAIAFGTAATPKTVDGPGALTLNTTGATSFTDNVGATTPLASLTIGAGGTGTTVGAASITTVGTQTYNSPLKLGNNLTLNTTSTSTDSTVGAITFGSTVGDSSPAQYSLTTATAGGDTVFSAGSNSLAGSLLSGLTTSANGSTVFDNANFETNGAQTYQGAVVVQSTGRTLALTADSGNIVFDKTLSSTKAASSDLTVTAKSSKTTSVTFGGAVGGDGTSPNDAALNRLTVDSPNIYIKGGVVNTASSNPRGTINDGLQTYTGEVFLGANTTFVGYSTDFEGGLTSDTGGPYNLTLNLSGPVTLPGTTALTNINDFATIGAGAVLINNNVTTNGSQTYSNGPVTIGGPASITLQAGTSNAAGGITINSAVNDQTTGMHSLTLLAGTTGTVTINGSIGTGTNGALGSLTAGVLTTTNPDNTTTTTYEPVTINGAGVTTTGLQSYGNLTLGAGTGGTLTTLSSTGNGGRIAAASVAGGGNSLTVSAPGSGSTSEFGAISNAGALQFNVAGVASFDDTITATSFNLGAGSYAALGGASITTTAGQTYGEAVRLSKDTTLADTTGDITLANVDSSSAFASYRLAVNTGGTTIFGGTVGFSYPLASVTTDAAGTTQINTTSIRTNGANGQQYNDPVTLGATTTLSAGTAPVFFGSTLGSSTANNATVPRGLTIFTSGLTTFSGQVGGAPGAAGSAVTTAPALASLNTTNNGEVDIKTGVTTVTIVGGAQNYSGVVRLTGDATLKGDTLSLSKSGLDGQGGQFSLTLDFADTQIAVPGAITGINNFASVGKGGTLINGLFSTKGTQLYGDAVTLGGVPNLQAAANITFGATVDGNALLTLNVSGTKSTAFFDGLIGNGTALEGLNVTTTAGTQFTIDASGSKANNGAVNVGANGVTIFGPVTFDVTNSTLADATHPTVLSFGGQTYNGAATLEADTGLVDTGNITFKSTVDGAFALAASTGGSEFFNGVIGGFTPLTGLTTDAPGIITTPGGQAQFDFAVDASKQAGVRVDGGVAIYDSSVFHIETSKAVAGVVTQPSVLTLDNGTQTYGGTVTLADETSLVSTAGTPAVGAAFTNGGQITFPALVTSAGGAQNFYVRTGSGGTLLPGTVDASVLDLGGALVTFGGNVGPVNIFSVEPNGGGTGGSITLGTGITTAGAQTYNTGVILGANAVFTSQNTAGDGGNITFAGTVNSDATARALTVNTSGLTIFNDLVGNSSPLLSLTTDNESKTGEQTQFNMKLTAPGTVAGVQVEGAVTINDPVLFGAVGSTLTVPTILTGVLGGKGSQTYASAATLGQNTVLTDVAVGNIRFGSTVDGTFDLSVNTSGDEFFGGLIGKTNPLASLETDQGGTPKGTAHFTMDLSAANTVAGVRVNGAVDIADNVEFAATNNAGTIPTILSGGTQTYATVLTGQTYTLGATVTQDTILTSTGSGNNGKLLFSTTADGPAALTLNTGGVTEFDGAVGGTTALASLTTDPNGTTQINGGSVSTTGGQTYGDAVLLGANTSLSSSAKGAIFFNSTVDGAFTLGINTAGLTTFKGAVGSGKRTALVSLTTLGSGAVEIDGGLVATTGAQNYGGNVTLGADTIFTSSNVASTGNISFQAKLDGAFALTVNTGARTLFNGPVGSMAPLASLTTDKGGTTEIGGGAITATGTQTYNDAVTFDGDATLTSTNQGDLLFVSTVTGGNALTLNTAGTTRFSDVVTLGSLTTDANGTTELYGGAVNSTGAQTYHDPVFLGANTILTSTAKGDLTFAQTVGGTFTLTLNTGGNNYFDGVVGGGQNALASLTTDAGGSTYIKGGSVNTVGSQTYHDAVVLQAGAILASSQQGDLFFGDTVDGAFALTLNTGGTTTFSKAVGGSGALASLTTDKGGTTRISGGAVITTGTQTYNDAVQIGADTTLASTGGGDLLFAATVSGAFGLTLDTAGITQFGDAITLASVTTDAGGTTKINGGTVLTTGAQTYNDSVLLGANTILTSTGSGAINLQALDGPFTLAVNTAGQTTFAGAVGVMTAPLVSLTTDAAGTTHLGGGLFITTGAQTYHDAVTLDKDATLISTNQGNIFFGSALVGARALTINTAGTTTFGGTVGGTDELASLTTDGPGNVQINGGSVTTTGAQTYGDLATLGANTTLTSTAGGGISFAKTLDSDLLTTPRALTISTGGDVTFGGFVGGNAPLATLQVGGSGVLRLNGGGVNTVGFQTYDDAVALGANAVLTSGSAGNIAFNSTLSGPFTLAVNTGGSTRFGGAVSLASLTTDAAGSTQLDGGLVVTTGAQTYNDAVVLGAGSMLNSTGAGNVTFGSTLDGAFALTINTGGVTRFNGTVGVTTPLASLTTGAAGSTVLDAGQVFTVGSQTYGNAVSLARDTVLTSNNAGDLRFGQTLDGAFALSLNTAGSHAV